MIDWKTLFHATNIPENLLPWLTNTGSMTRALEEASEVSCQIAIQQEGWQEPWSDERLGATGWSPCWIREVVITTHQPVIFARSVSPRELIERFPQLMRLGEKPLGKTIFADNTFQRGPIEVAEISDGQFLWERIPESFRPETCWARRSQFYAGDVSFLLTEVFLSDFNLA